MCLSCDRGQYSGAVLDELESQNDAQVEGIMGKVRILKDVSFLSTPGREERSEQWTMGLWLTVCPIADDYGHRRRDQGILRPSREDERLLRQHETAPAKHHEPHAPDGREDGRRLEGLARLLRRRGPDLHVRLAVLVKSLARRSSSLSYFKSYASLPLSLSRRTGGVLLHG